MSFYALGVFTQLMAKLFEPLKEPHGVLHYCMTCLGESHPSGGSIEKRNSHRFFELGDSAAGGRKGKTAFMGAFGYASTLGNGTEQLESNKVDSGGVYLRIHVLILAKPSQNEKA